MILLTGAKGFVGQAIRRKFLRQVPDESLLCLSRDSDEDSTHQQCNLRDPAQVAQLPCDTVTCLIHVAAATPGSDGDFFEDNIRATANLLTALRDAPLRSVFLISSLSVYDWRTPRPETVVLKEDCNVFPEDDYGRSKLTQEWLIQAFAGSRLRMCIFRPSSIFGPGMLPRSVLPHWLLIALGGGPLTLTGPRGYQQNFVYVEDVATLVCRAYVEGTQGIFNLFSHDTLELPALAETICQLTGNPHPIEDAQHDTPCAHLAFDNSRLMDTFDPSFTPFVEALRVTIAWLKAKGVAT
jgi:UDP-glucose 4-epimerase